MELSILLLLLILFAFAIIGFLIGRYLAEQKIRKLRKDAVLKSRSSLMGKMLEHVAPYLPGFKYHPADMRFLGAPIDYVVFEGMNEKDIKKVIFLEVKSGSSSLNAQERKLKAVIEKGSVKWEEFRVNLKK